MFSAINFEKLSATRLYEYIQTKVFSKDLLAKISPILY